MSTETLLEACTAGDIEAILENLRLYPEGKNNGHMIMDCYDNTSLTRAVANGKTDAVRILLENGLAIDEKAMRFATIHCCTPELLPLLLEFNPSVGVANHGIDCLTNAISGCEASLLHLSSQVEDVKDQVGYQEQKKSDLEEKLSLIQDYLDSLK